MCSSDLRLERFEGAPEFLLDGAHNPHGALALRAFLQEQYPEGVWMIFGAMSDKKSDEMVSTLLPCVQTMIFTAAKSGRSRDPKELQVIAPSSRVAPEIEAAMDYARAHCPAGVPVVVCGSLYLVGEARAALGPRRQ